MTMLVLATDMARHGEIMDGFKEKLELGFDYSKKDHMDSVMLQHNLSVEMWQQSHCYYYSGFICIGLIYTFNLIFYLHISKVI